MISEISIRPKPQNKRADRLFYSLLLVAVAIISATYLLEKWRGVVSVFALVAIVAALWIYSRFMYGEYSYDVVYDSYGTPLFVVRKITGSRVSTLCNVELSAIREVEVLESGKDEKKLESGTKKYNYCPTLGAVKRARLAIKTRYESSVILIEGSDEFFALLSSYAKEAREMAMNEEE